MRLFETREKYKAGSITKRDYIEQMHRLHAMLFEYSEFMQGTDIASIAITDDRVVMTSRAHGIRIVCDKDDRRLAPIEILNFGDYEKAEYDASVRLIGNRFTIVDIGANIGWYSLSLAKTFTDATIFSFEPIPMTFRQLRQNVEINGVSNIRIYDFGFWDREEEITFYYYPEGSGNASAARLSDEPSTREIRCRVMRLDDFCEQNGVRVDFIKCDVEGAELHVFRGGMKTIRQHKPVIFAEMLRKWSAEFNYHPNDIIALLAKEGYRCFTTRGSGLAAVDEVTEETVETNFFFLHAHKHASLIDTLARA